MLKAQGSRMTKGHKQGAAAQRVMTARTANHGCAWAKFKVENSPWASEMDVENA